MSQIGKYRPATGTDGMIFEEKFCSNCAHGASVHSDDPDAEECGISQAAFLFDIDSPMYPEQWVYDEKGKPTCTAFEKWDWLQRPDGPGAPPPLLPGPRQLKIAFWGDENTVTNGNIHA